MSLKKIYVNLSYTLTVIFFSFQTCLLDILDTAGQEEYSALRDQYTRDGDCFLIVYSIDNPQTLQEAESLHEFLKRVKGIDNPACVSTVKSQEDFTNTID